MSPRIYSVLALAMLGIASTVPASGEIQRTGTHLESRTARPATLFINKPTAIDEILNSIQAGNHQQAVALARKHVDDLRTTQVVHETTTPQTLYFALNALCVALTTAGEIEEALATCSEAIAQAPSRWTAWNSRGTTHFANQTFDAAVSDFLRANALAPDNEDIVDTIQWNIRLAREREVVD